MTSPSPNDLKKRLIASGLEIFRVQAALIHLADRVRDNLIMDSGVAAVVANPPAVRLVFRAQSTHFPGEGAEALFGRARLLALETQRRGYTEVGTTIVPIKDPGGGPSTLDTWYEVAYERAVEEKDLIDELRYALGVEKTASTG